MMWSKLKSFLKKNRILHFLVTYYRDEEFRRDYRRYLKDNPSKKSKESIKKEIKMIRDYWGRYPFHIYYHYYRYGLYEKNLTNDQLLDYIPPFYYYNIYWERRHTGVNRSLYESKLFQHQLFTKYSIPSIDNIAFVKKGELFGPDNEHLTINDVIENQLQNENDALFFKPEFGRGGSGIVFLNRGKNGLLLNNRSVSVEEILSSLSKDEDYLVQDRFIQNFKMAKINQSSVNTLRVYTQERGGEVVVPACILRMGINNSIVDNFAQGGLINIIDVDSGNLSEFAQTNKVDRKYYEHPDSHYVFKDSRIENWMEIKSDIIKYAYLLNECKDLGWDVAIGKKGFKILEINIQYGMDIQLVYGGMRKILNLYPY